MATFVPKHVTVEATALYVNNTCVGNNVPVTLPAVTPATTDVDGLMGTMSVPLQSIVESMEATVGKKGLDDNSYLLTCPGTKAIMFKWVQDKVGSDGSVSLVGCKAELKAMPKVYSPESAIEVGSTTESDIPLEVYELKITVDGVTVFHINRLTSTLKCWDGKQLKDYSQKFNSLL